MNWYKSVWLDLWGGTSGTFNGFDIFGRIIDQRWQNSIGGSPADIDRYKYRYDLNSNRQWKQNTVGSTLDEYYTYDNLNRLIEMQRGTLNGGFTGITGTPVREMDYTLDPTGNWPTYLTKTSGTTDLNQGRTSNTVNEITNITASGGTPVWATPAYDAAGNMTTLPQPASLTSSYTATYDAWNRLTQLNAGATTVAKYQYDGTNRRIVKLTYTSGTLSETRHFYYTNNWQDIEERTSTNTSMDKQLVWGIRYIDELICRDDATPLRLYATQDANFNVTSLVSTAGAVQQRLVYDPYGNSTVLTAAWGSTSDAYAWTTRFTGQFFDVETQLYYYRVRYYHTLLGAFIIRDLIQLANSQNLYEYVNSDPANRLDPSSEWAIGGGGNLTGTIALPILGIGIGIQGTLRDGFYAGHDAAGFFCEDCTTALLGPVIGGGGAIAAGWAPFAAFKVGGRPANGPGFVLGAFAAVGPPLVPPGAVVNGSISVSTSGTVTISVPGIGIGGAAFIGLSFQGTCTACTNTTLNIFTAITNAGIRLNGILNCMTILANNLLTAINLVVGKTIPPQGQTFTFQLPAAQPPERGIIGS